MSDMSTLRDNIELILAHKEEIQNYPPYKFSRLVIRDPGRITIGPWYYFNMFMGAYVDVWHKYLQGSHDPAVLPLYMATGQFGTIYKFLGLSMPDKQLIKKVPKNMTFGCMRGPMWDFMQENKEIGLGVPLSQMVKELKEGKPREERDSYKLIALRDDFYRAVSSISGIQYAGEPDLNYTLDQDGHFRFRISVSATIHLELNEEEKKELVLGGSAAELHDLVLQTRKDLTKMATDTGFPFNREENSRTNWTIIKFIRSLPSADEVLHTETINPLSHMLQAMRKRIRRL